MEALRNENALLQRHNTMLERLLENFAKPREKEGN